MSGRVAAFFLIFSLLVAMVLAALGVWQWQRRAEKTAYIAAVAKSAGSIPKALNTAHIWDRVRIRGQYISEKALYVQFSRPAPKWGERDSRGKVPVSGFGVLVMTPFSYNACGTDGFCVDGLVFVNRGFLPTPPNGQIPPFATPVGEISLTGFLRPNEIRSLFQPGNDVDRRVFFLRNLPDLARAAGLASIEQRFFIDRQAEPDEAAPPYGIEVAAFLKAIPNNHLEYAITWWSLAATSLGIAIMVLFASRRERQETNKRG